MKSQAQQIKEASLNSGIKEGTIKSRIYAHGITIEDAVAMGPKQVGDRYRARSTVKKTVEEFIPSTSDVSLALRYQSMRLV